MNGKRNMHSKLSAAECPVNHLLSVHFPIASGRLPDSRESHGAAVPMHAEILTLTMREAVA
jgi:hypothetical protein